MVGLVGDQRLLERAGELERLEALVAAAGGGKGDLVVVEGEAGIGKTRLLAAARQMAAGQGFTVLAGRGGELEREFGYGVARQLFEAHLRSLPEPERAALLSGAAAPAAAVLGFAETGPAPGPDAAAVTEHGLYWLTVDLAAGSPLILCVDDVHWSDRASLRWLVYLARRLEDLGVGVIVGWRTGEPGSPRDLLDALREQPEVETLTPGALSEEGSATIVREALGAGAEEAFCTACWKVSGGNPLLLGELLRALAGEHIAPTADTADRVAEIGPTAVARSVLVRLSRLPPAASALARAVAVLDNDAQLGHASALAGIGEPAALESVGALAAAHIFEPGGDLRFAHPILRTAVYEDLGEADRAALHHRAARLLEDAGQRDRAAVHLMKTDPAGDGAASSLLHAAGVRALKRGAPDTSVALLGRALREPPQASERFALLVDLGRAERFTGDPQAVEHLREALALAQAPAERVLAARELSNALMFAGRGDECVEMLEGAIAAIPDSERECRLRLEIELTTHALSVIGPAADRLADRLAALARSAPGETPAERALLATFAFNSTLRLRGSAEEAAAIAERAWSDGRLLQDVGALEQMPIYYAMTALTAVDRVALARSIGDQAVALAREQRSAAALCGAFANRGRAAWASGDLVVAEADLREAIHLGSLTGLHLAKNYALGTLCLTLVQAGKLDAAERALAEHGFLDGDTPPNIQSANILVGRAELRIEQGRHRDALRDAEEFWERYASRAGSTVAIVTRAHALALLHEGNAERATELVDARLAAETEFGAATGVALALASRGLVHGGAQGLEMLEQAARVASDSPRRVTQARILVDLGAALRRANRRSDAREPLGRALEIAHACGAGLIEREARDELLACGARPRRLVLSGADALTASERRIADMAADGHTNREIAQALFVTPKTVETHMRAIFRKLDVASRTEIAEVLSAARGEPASPEAPSPLPIDAEPAGDDSALATILFTDIAGSTEKAAQLGNSRWRELLDRHDALVRAELERFRGREVKPVGEGFLATFDSPTRAVRCACSLRAQLTALGLQLRAGVHTGECSLANGDLRGRAVHVAARLAALAPPGEVLVSESARGLVEHPTLQFHEQGAHELTGTAQSLDVHAVTDVAAASHRAA